MSLKTYAAGYLLESDAAAAVYTEAIANEGCVVDYHGLTAPGALMTVEGSWDKENWIVLSDLDGAAMSALGLVLRTAREKPRWIRLGVATDQSAVRQFYAILAQTQETN